MKNKTEKKRNENNKLEEEYPKYHADTRIRYFRASLSNFYYIS